MHFLLLALVLTLSFSSSSRAAGTPQAGQTLAERWCASCHLVTPWQTQASADVPSFGSIANKTEQLDWLVGFLADPHPPMPTLSPTRQEIQDLVAYFEFLREK
jgi:mono/diheme cytochrome c family protein